MARKSCNHCQHFTLINHSLCVKWPEQYYLYEIYKHKWFNKHKMSTFYIRKQKYIFPAGSYQTQNDQNNNMSGSNCTSVDVNDKIEWYDIDDYIDCLILTTSLWGETYMEAHFLEGPDPPTLWNIICISACVKKFTFF